MSYQPLKELQACYLLTGKGLDKMYYYLEDLASVILYNICKSKGLKFSLQKRENMCHDASTYFIETYYIQRTVRIDYFYPMLRFFVYKQLGWDKRGKFSKERQWDELQDLSTTNNIPQYKEPTIEEQLLIREIKETYVYLPYILVAEPVFKEAILRADREGVPRSWINENILELQRIHGVLKYHKLGEYRKDYLKSLKKKLPNTTLKNLLS